MSSINATGNINWAYGDGGDVEDLGELAEGYGYSLRPDDKWWNEKDDTDGDTVKTDQEMWQYIWDMRESDAEDWALSGTYNE